MKSSFSKYDFVNCELGSIEMVSGNSIIQNDKTNLDQLFLNWSDLKTPQRKVLLTSSLKVTRKISSKVALGREDSQSLISRRDGDFDQDLDGLEDLASVSRVGSRDVEKESREIYG